MKSAIVVALFAVGCGGGASSNDASPNLDAGLDAATSFCVGTALDHTCAQAFLAPLAACLDATPMCTTQGSATNGTVCWSTGAELTLSTTSVNGGTNFSASGTRNGLSCFVTTVTGSSSSPYVISAPNTGGSLTYYPSSGMIICPTNESFTAGTNYAGCDAFHVLLTGPAFSSCTAGTCP
jgi:hypothetical protein